MKPGFLETLCSTLIAGTLTFSCVTSKYQKSTLNQVQIQSIISCLQEKKVVMYGAAWCSNCEQQKEYFGESFSSVPYVECYEDFDGKKRGKKNETCKEISAYPAWVFFDGEIVYGVKTPEELADLAGCG